MPRSAEGIIKKANQKFYNDSVREYPKETLREENYDNYIVLHTGRKAGKTMEPTVQTERLRIITVQRK